MVQSSFCPHFCQPELAIGPSASLTNSSGGSSKGSPSEKEELYLRKNPKKTDGKSSLDNVLYVLKTVVENDPLKEYMTFAGEEAECSHRHGSTHAAV